MHALNLTIHHFHSILSAFLLFSPCYPPPSFLFLLPVLLLFLPDSFSSSPIPSHPYPSFSYFPLHILLPILCTSFSKFMSQSLLISILQLAKIKLEAKPAILNTIVQIIWHFHFLQSWANFGSINIYFTLEIITFLRIEFVIYTLRCTLELIEFYALKI